jgi:menaquinone-dependent protoporphyrinogen oxidase
MKILVAAASRYGSTLEIAARIGQVLNEGAHHVDVAPVEEITDLVGYDAVVVGSAVYAGRWIRPAREFVDGHAEILSARPLWLFSSGPVGDPPMPEGDVAPDPVPDLAPLGARDHHIFAGKLDRSRLHLGDRAVAAALRAPEGDFRDWEEIERWARLIADQLALVGTA